MTLDRPPLAGVDRGGFRTAPVSSDIEEIEALVRSTGFFNDAEVAVARELVEAAFDNGSASGYELLIDGVPGRITGYTCFGPILGTLLAFDLYWIVIEPHRQRQGRGRALLDATLDRIRLLKGRHVYAETSGRELYSTTRRFYEANGFVVMAELPDFYAPGDSKIIFRKDIQG